MVMPRNTPDFAKHRYGLFSFLQREVRISRRYGNLINVPLLAAKATMATASAWSASRALGPKALYFLLNSKAAMGSVIRERLPQASRQSSDTSHGFPLPF